MRILISLLFIVFTNSAFAGPQMTICLSDCNKRKIIQISDQTWNEVITIFKKDIDSEQNERNSIALALKCVEQDIIEQFITQLGEDGDYERISEQITNKAETFNTRKAIILFIDNGFIQKHLLRQSQKRTIWIGSKESAVALQSKKTGAIYIVDPTSTTFGSEPNISLYSQWKDEKSLKRIPQAVSNLLPRLETTETDDDDSDFE